MHSATVAVRLKTNAVMVALNRHPRHKKLIAAGRQPDSLLRALIPLYVTERGKLEHLVTSGVTRLMWHRCGVRVHATVMAKALREHVGYARRTREGWQITPNGTKYVEAGLQ